MARTKAVLFDLDGTLIDSREDLTAAVNYVRGRFGLSRVSSADVVRHTGHDLRHLVEYTVIRSLPDADLDATLGGFRVHYRRHMLDRTHPYPGVVEALEKLATAGIRLAVATSKPARLSREILSGLGISNHFKAVLGPEAVGPAGKPSSALLIAAAEQLQVPPRSCLVVGDTHMDIQAGRTAKMRTCAVTWGFGEEKDLVSAEPDLVVRTPAEWIGLLGVNGKGRRNRAAAKPKKSAAKKAPEKKTTKKPAAKKKAPKKTTKKPAKKPAAKKAPKKTTKKPAKKPAAKKAPKKAAKPAKKKAAKKAPKKKAAKKTPRRHK